jgi:hypothetical protein
VFSTNFPGPLGAPNDIISINASLQLCFDNAPCPLLQIVDSDTNNILSNGGAPENITTGQQVNLRASTQSGTGAITNPLWVVPGSTVKSYSWNGLSATLTTALNLSSNDVSFYWTGGGSSPQQTVTLSAFVNGIPQNVSAPMNIVAPTGTFSISTSKVSELVAATHETVFFAGSATIGKDGRLNAEQEGSNWQASVQSPANAAAGQIGFVQIATADRKGTFGGQSGVVTGTGIDWKRGGAVLASGPIEGGLYDTPVTIGAGAGSGASATVSSSDSPFQFLKTPPSGVAATASVFDRFDLYLMYKPNTANSIWVTLSKATWGWGFNSSWSASGNRWRLDPGSFVRVSSPAGSSTTLPIWSQAAPFPSGP